MRAYLAPDRYSDMLQPNPNLAWILNDTHIGIASRGHVVGHGHNRKRWN